MLIKIKNLRLKVVMGVYDWERSINRDIIINVEIATKEEKSLISDNISDTIDYALISKGIEEVVQQKHYKLIEKMAQAIMDFIMQDQRIDSCKLEIDKLSPMSNVDSCAIVITQNRKHGS